MMHRTKSRPALVRAIPFIALLLLVAACVMGGTAQVPRHGWWRGLGPVVPHESFPAACETCHVASNWQDLREDFSFDHEAETGVRLEGAHDRARCLRCHNDRGSTQEFARRGCVGCHEDVHQSRLGGRCTDCHGETSWVPRGQLERHNRTRFPLVGAHAATSCRRCHEGAEVGRFLPTDVQCVSCHASDLQRAQNPNHAALGWVDRCDRCHLPTHWNSAEL